MTPASKRLGVGVGALGALLTMTTSRPALAINCADLPTPIYGLGASAPKPIIAKLATALTNASPPETLIFKFPGACHGPNALINGTKMSGTASYWNAAGKETTCDLAIAGNDVDVGIAGTYATLCPGIDQLPANVGDFIGAIQPYVFVVPKASSQTSISAAAAYFAYGFGATGQAKPWVDESALVTRDPNSGAAIIVALATGVPVAKLKGVDAMTNANTIALVSQSLTPEAAIGFCSGETADANQDKVNVLAYQHYGQDCGYWPSSTALTFDKRNIRDGHYYLWAPMHLFAHVDGAGKPVSPGAAKLIGYLMRTLTPPAGVDMAKIEITAGGIPDCAMEVKRSSDLGPLSSYAPAEPCGCYFDKTATGQTTCQACAANNECPVGAPNCRYGYCEVN